MQKGKTILGVGIVIAVLLLGTILSETETSVDSPFSLKSWFTHTLGIQQFSVVGDSGQCDQQPSDAYSQTGHRIVLKNSHYTASASSYCSSGHGLFDVYSPDWNPYKEFRDSVDFTCGASSSCNVELYCCDHPECSSDSNCQSWVGEYSTCKTASCTSWNGGYKCTTDYGTETDIPYCKSSFKYCSQNTHKDCYYVSGSSCVKHTYPGVTTCPASYAGNTLYSSLSTCNSNICVPTTCASLGKQCGSVSDGCGGTLNCGTCNTGYSCNSNGYCESNNATTVLCADVISCDDSLLGCNGTCPDGYVAGIVDSCGFHDCIPINETEPNYTPNTPSEETPPTFDINMVLFKIGNFNVTLLMLIIGVVLLIILMNFIPRK